MSSHIERYPSVFPFWNKILSVLTITMLIAVTVGSNISAATFTPPTVLVVTKTADTADGFCDIADCSLREAIIEANNGSGDYLIEVPAGTYTISIISISGDEDDGEEGDLDIGNSDGTITIQGDSASTTIIEGDGTYNRVIEILSNSTVELETLTVTGANTSEEGAGIMVDEGDLTLTDVVVNYNYVNNNQGGGISNIRGVLTIYDSIVSDNWAVADIGGGIYATYAETYIFSSKINNNSAGSYGGGIYSANGVLEIENSEIIFNTTESSGAGVFNSNGDLVITTSTIKSNSALNVGGDGAGVFCEGSASNCAISDSIIEKNIASYDGGGIYNSDSILEIDNTLISENFAGDDGGGINGEYGGIMTITNSLITDNEAYDDGGGIYSDENDLTIDSTNIDNNDVVTGYGGGLMNEEGEVFISNNSSISYNTAERYGGGIHNDNGVIEIELTDIIGNESRTRDGGGIYSSEDGEISLSEVSVFDNIAYADGGGISNLGLLVIDSSNIEGNQAGNDGGGFTNEVYGDITITNSTVSQNIAGSDGGGFYTENETIITIENSDITYNQAGERGGAVYNSYREDPAVVSIENSDLSYNTAELTGGAIYNENQVTISGSTLSYNDSKDGGGAIYNDLWAILDIDTSTFDHNSVSYQASGEGGGALFNEGTALVQESLFVNNESVNSGGAIYNAFDLEIINTTFYENITVDPDTYGGAIYNQGDVLIMSSTITENLAWTDGGGIYSIGGNAEIRNSILANNLKATLQKNNCSGGTITSEGYNLEDINTCGLSKPGDQFNTYPKLDIAGLQNNGGLIDTVALFEHPYVPSKSSPAIDAGICTDIGGTAVTVDQRGYARDAKCDIGAYEVL
ncbi:CSLREA domain-containing protein [Candidatus Peregrinibacteria bacterium]|nr:CSLREA domain-containing protein [Candidatus Peregrinibacteria bacterium]MBT7703759.1 CSLREA domain-containing protein [Candidatus Peregrinibacteria bacterium]